MTPFTVQSKQHLEIEHLQVAQTMRNRMTNLAQHATTNARWYMWKSVVPWTLDYPLFGSGPDTIRYYITLSTS